MTETAKRAKLHNYGKIPEGYQYSYGDIGELEDRDAERLGERNVVEGWYWYAYGDYEGSGWILMLDKDGRWHEADMGHCSCNGPTEDVFINGEGFESLASYEKACTKEHLVEVLPLIAWARKAVPGERAKEAGKKKKVRGFQNEKAKRQAAWPARKTNW